MAEPTPQEFYAQVLEDARGYEPNPYPGAFSRFVHHPGVLAHRTKTPEEYDQDQRFAYVLRRLEEQYPNSAYRASKFPRLADFRSEDWDTPYQHVGVMGEGQPVSVGLSWMGMGTSAVNNLGAKNLANQADWAVSKMAGGEYQPPYPNAIEDGVRDANTFSFYLPEYLSGRTLPDHDTTSRKPIELTDNYEVLKNAGVPDYAAIPISAIHDGAADPFGAFGFLRAAKMPLRQGLRAMAWDFGPEAGMRTGGEVLEGLLGE